MSVLQTIRGQFTTLPYPEEDCSGTTVIVTGGNTGIGIEAARHFVRLNAARVIVACRSADKGAAAKRSIESSTQRHGVVDVWQLDLTSFESVKEFAARASKLDRLDVLLNNASVLMMTPEFQEGHETMVTVNVLSTFLLTLLLLPTLRQSAARFNMTPHIVIVSSDGAFLAFFPQRAAENIFEELKNNKKFTDRYNTTKLIQLMLMQKLAAAIDDSGKGRIIVNALNPGFCSSQLFRNVYFPINILFSFFFLLFARSCEMGSRTLMAASFAGDEFHGKFMTDCKLQRWPSLMNGEPGAKLTDKVWDELLQLMDEAQPGVTQNI